MTAEEKAVAPSSSSSRDQRTALSLCVCSITRSHPIALPRPPADPLLGQSGRVLACASVLYYNARLPRPSGPPPPPTEDIYK